MSNHNSGRRALAVSSLVGVIAVIAALQAGPVAAQSSELKQSGTVTVSQTQVAFIGSGNFGGGELAFEGRTYSFTIGGLGVGGFGVSTIEAQGEVYNLINLSDFEGAYGQARVGLAVADVSTGQLWLESPSGVYIHLIAKRKGLALSLGGDAVYISID